MNFATHPHQPAQPKRSSQEWTSHQEKGRKYEPFDGGKIEGDQRSMARALRMDRKR